MTDSQSDNSDQLMDKIDTEMAIKRQNFRKLSNKSFLIQPERLDKDSSMRKFMLESKKRDIVDYRRQKESTFSSWRLKYFASKNTEFLSYLLIELNAFLVTQPLLTLKTRMQAKNAQGDYAQYLKNQVETKSLYKGITHSYTLCLLHFSIFMNVQKLTGSMFLNSKFNFTTEKINYTNYLISDLLTSPFRCALEIRRSLFQMGNVRVSGQETLFKIRQTFFPLLIRDFIFRSVVYSALANSDQRKNKVQRLWEITMTLLLATLISNPIDVVCTKLYTQKIEVYKGLLGTLRTIVQEEGRGKLFIGFSMRFAALSVATLLNFVVFDSLRDFADEAFSNDILI